MDDHKLNEERPKPDTSRQAEIAFRLYDKDKDGFITKSEMEKLSKTLSKVRNTKNTTMAIFICNFFYVNVKIRKNLTWKLLKMLQLNFWILAFSTNFCPIKTDLSGNTVWQQALDFQKLAKMNHF